MNGRLLRGGGLFYGMSFLTHALLPDGIGLPLALCRAGARDGEPARCASHARIDCFPKRTSCEGPPSRHPETALRVGAHACAPRGVEPAAAPAQPARTGRGRPFRASLQVRPTVT